MKKIVLGVVLALSSSAFAHGSLAEQAANAVKSAGEVFVAANPKEITKGLISVTATLLGHERFGVVITTKDKTEFKYDCLENEKVSPVVWECR